MACDAYPLKPSSRRDKSNSAATGRELEVGAENEHQRLPRATSGRVEPRGRENKRSMTSSSEHSSGPRARLLLLPQSPCPSLRSPRHHVSVLSAPPPKRVCDYVSLLIVIIGTRCRGLALRTFRMITLPLPMRVSYKHAVKCTQHSYTAQRDYHRK